MFPVPAMDNKTLESSLTKRVACFSYKYPLGLVCGAGLYVCVCVCMCGYLCVCVCLSTCISVCGVLGMGTMSLMLFVSVPLHFFKSSVLIII